jgi:uncharacterized protein YqgV (UPF0045/DUF77 family)
VLVEIQVLPDPTGTAAAQYHHVNAAIARIRDSGVHYEVGALGTTLEGAPDVLWPLIRAAHEATLVSGADRVVTIIKLAESAADPETLTIDRLTRSHRQATS